MIKHVGVILDGNRRFAVRLMKKPWMGHRYGLEKARETLKWACEFKIKHLTAYVLSLENLRSRPKRELAYILKYLGMEADNILQNSEHIVHQNNVRVRFIGRTQMLPGWLQEKMRKVEELTKNYDKHYLNVAVAYGGQQEIVDATKRILEEGLAGVIKPSDLNEQILKEHMYTNGQPMPDLIIRTGGERRLSNFLPYQSVYSELIFLDKKWPEMTKKDFKGALDEFQKRRRRFGK
jgi:tritrans,polycis-undecaprenyl-diphosphate synthase [geranylgeranyl-diphosphate specific]